jgi:hypothetical protein
MKKSSQTAWQIVPLRHFFPLMVVPLIEILLYEESTLRSAGDIPSIWEIWPPFLRIQERRETGYPQKKKKKKTYCQTCGHTIAVPLVLRGTDTPSTSTFPPTCIQSVATLAEATWLLDMISLCRAVLLKVDRSAPGSRGRRRLCFLDSTPVTTAYRIRFAAAYLLYVMAYLP